MMQKNLIKDAKKFVNILLTPLENHYYHSYEHAIDVMQRAVYLANKEGLSIEDIQMMALAGLFHDTGFAVSYDNNEPIGAKIAANYLRTINYPTERIAQIRDIILATDPEYKDPKNIYEKIIKDADMDNLGRDDFKDRARSIKKEIETIKKIKIKDPDWNHSLVQLLMEHTYNTDSQKQERISKKYENIKKMLKQVREEFREELKNNKKVKRVKYLEF